MTEKDDIPAPPPAATPAPGVEETATPWVTPAVLHARPVKEPIDWHELIEEIHRNFPKTLARLAE